MRMLTSPCASMPSVTDFTLNSVSSLLTCMTRLIAWYTASTGPVPIAEPRRRAAGAG